MKRRRSRNPWRRLLWPSNFFVIVGLALAAFLWAKNERPGWFSFVDEVIEHATAEPYKANQPTPKWIAGQASVIDGDTLEIHGQRIRLYGIDAPENDQTCTRDGKPWRCGQTAALELSGFIGSQTVRCAERGQDRYGRMIGKCEAKGVDLGQWMVEQGLALAYRKYAINYIANEDRARGARKGMWAGVFQPPWDYRRERRND